MRKFWPARLPRPRSAWTLFFGTVPHSSPMLRFTLSLRHILKTRSPGLYFQPGTGDLSSNAIKTKGVMVHWTINTTAYTSTLVKSSANARRAAPEYSRKKMQRGCIYHLLHGFYARASAFQSARRSIRREYPTAARSSKISNVYLVHMHCWVLTVQR